MQIEAIGTWRAALGECPVWDAEPQRLWMADCRNSQIVCIDPNDGRMQHWQCPAPIGSFALNTQHSLVVALKTTFGLLHLSDHRLQHLASIEDAHPHLRLNDGCALPDGSFLAGSMHIYRAEGEAPLGGIYRLDTQGQLSRIAPGFGVFNGPAIHPHTAQLYACDSEARKIYRYTLTTAGQLSQGQVFADTCATGSAPDGCCFDQSGGLWTALVQAGAVVRFDAHGKLDQRIDLPLKHPSSVCFGGAGLQDLFVTSISNSERLHATGALDGALLRIRGTGHMGVPRPRCQILPAMVA